MFGAMTSASRALLQTLLRACATRAGRTRPVVASAPDTFSVRLHACARVRALTGNLAGSFAGIAVLLLLLAGAPAFAAADDGRNYADVPRVTTTDPGFFRGLLASSSERVVRLAVLGDSQETAPFGWGRHYLAHLNARFAKVFGPAGESHLLTCVNAVDPPMWLGTSGEATLRAAAATPPEEILPSVAVHGLLAGKGAPAAAFRSVLLHDASRCVDDALEGGPWFSPASAFVPEVLARRVGPSPGILWQGAPTDGDLPEPAAPVLASGASGFDRAVPKGAWAWLPVPELGLGGRRHLQVAVRGASSTFPLDVAGIRFRDSAAWRGIVVQSFAKGGMRLPDLVSQHGASGALLRAIGPDVAVLCFGANDAGNLADLAVWRAQLLEAIAWIRAAMQDPGFPVVIAAELRTESSFHAAQILDGMPVVAHEIALADPRVLALNLRRIAEEEYGWGEFRPYLADTAHFRPYAQRLLAEAFVGELCAALGIDDPSCGEARWADCVRTWGSACAQGGCRMLIDADVAELGLAWNGPGTTCMDADGDGAPDLCPPGGPSDVNRDGYVDAADLAIVLANWGTRDAASDVDRSGLVDAGDLAAVLAEWGR